MRERYRARSASMFCWKPSANAQSAYSAGISWSPGVAASSTTVSMYLARGAQRLRAGRRAVAGDDVLGRERGQAVEDREPVLGRDSRG